MSKIKVKLDSDEIFVLVEMLELIKDKPFIIAKISGKFEGHRQTINKLHEYLGTKMLDAIWESNDKNK